MHASGSGRAKSEGENIAKTQLTSASNIYRILSQVSNSYIVPFHSIHGQVAGFKGSSKREGPQFHIPITLPRHRFIANNFMQHRILSNNEVKLL
jgi:hypothetical protein